MTLPRVKCEGVNRVIDMGLQNEIRKQRLRHGSPLRDIACRTDLFRPISTVGGNTRRLRLMRTKKASESWKVTRIELYLCCSRWLAINYFINLMQNSRGRIAEIFRKRASDNVL